MAFVDESGLLLSPLVRRTLAPKGETPQLPIRGRFREKVSIIATLTMSPKRCRLGLYFNTIPNGSFNGATVATFLRQLLRHIRGRVVVVWDRWTGHRCAAVREVLADHPRLKLVSLPAYAPELNPVEYLWSHLKWSELCNFGPTDAHDLNRAITPALHRTKLNQKLMVGFWLGTRLKLPRWLC